MSGRAVLFSIGQGEVDTLLGFEKDEEKLDYLQEEIEELYFEDYPDKLAELDKSWNLLNTALGKLVQEKTTDNPLGMVIFGGKDLYEGNDYTMILKTPDMVKNIVSAIKTVTKTNLEKAYMKKYFDIEPDPSKENFEYLWGWFEKSKPFWHKAAEDGRYVLFTVDASNHITKKYKNPPALEEDINKFLKEIDFKIPDSFINFYKKSNGTECEIGECWVSLYEISEIISCNKDYEVNDYIPEFFLIGTNAGGEAYCIEKASGKIFMIPFIGMSKEDAVPVAETFEEFLNNPVIDWR